MSIVLMRILTLTTSVVVAATALGIIPSKKGILRILRPTAAAATEKSNKKDASQVDPHAAAAAAATAEEEEALLTSEFYEGISVKVELMLSSDDDEDADVGEERASNKVQTESETSAAGEANSKAGTAINSICGAPGAGRATSVASGRKQQQQLWTVKDKKLSLVIVKSAASGSGGDERCNHRSGIIGGSECDRGEPPPSPSPPPQSSRECSDHSGHLHCYRSNLVSSGDAAGEKRNAVEKVTVGVSANGGERRAKKKRKKKRRRGRNKCDGGGGGEEECEGRRRATTSMSSSRSMSAFSSFISRTHSRRWMTGMRRGSAGSADQQKSYMMSNNGGVTTLRMNFSAAAADGRTMSHTPASIQTYFKLNSTCVMYYHPVTVSQVDKTRQYQSASYFIV